jgi:hypothetical protein
METCDDEFVDAACDFIEAPAPQTQAVFCWVSTTHMHFRTHTKRRSLGKAGHWQSPYHDTMLDHAGNVGQLLDLLDELGIAEDTIVLYATDLRTDPFERADTTSNTYWDWYVSKAYVILAAQAIVAEFLATFEQFPPRQKAASFTIDQALEKMADATSGARG